MPARNFDPHLLRPLEYICEPDPTSAGFGAPFRRKGLADYHAQVASVVLRGTPPEDVMHQFEVARNLFLYGWFVYRFYTVADHQAFSALELALRLRFEKEIPKSYFRGSRFLTLRPLLRYAVDEGHIKPQGFSRWNENAEARARYRYDMEKIAEMREKGLDRIEVDYSELEVTDQDRNWSYLEGLVEGLPLMRNDHAHGSSAVQSPSVGTIELVAEIIDQIYPKS